MNRRTPNKAVSLVRSGCILVALSMLAGAANAGPSEKRPPEKYSWPDKPHAEIKGIPGIVSSVRFTPKEDIMAYSIHQGQMRFWNVAKTEHLPGKIVLPNTISGMDVSDSGKYFVTAGKGDRTSQLILWDLASKEKVWECNDFKYLCSARFFPGSERIAAIDFWDLKLFNADSNKPTASYPSDPGFLSFLDFSRDGKRIYVVGRAFGKFHIYEPEAKEVKKTVFCRDYPISAFVVLRDRNDVVLGACNKPLLFYSEKDESTSEILRQSRNWVNSMAASPDGQWLGVCDHKRFSLWHLGEKMEYFKDESASSYGVWFSPRGTYLVVSRYDALRVSSSILIWKRISK